MSRIFSDFHHAGLLRSLILLFEKRLNYELFRPIGRDWFNRGYWKIYDHPATVAQFLDIGGATPDDTLPLNEVKESSPPVYICQDIDEGVTNKAITYEGFMSMDFDIVIASIPQHIEPFNKLCTLHPNKPKLIFQIGNAWTIEAGLAPNVMASAIINDVPENINFVSYHQEFPLDIYYKGEPHQDKRIASFVNAFPTMGHFAQDWGLFQKIEELMPEWDFKCHGASGRDNPLHGDRQVAQAMREQMFIWHTKRGGDGYGHVVHNTGAVGRPMIVKKEYYNGKFAEALMVDEVTCVTIDGLGYNEIVNKILHFTKKARYAKMCFSIMENFNKVVNFDKETLQIKDFLSNLK